MNAVPLYVVPHSCHATHTEYRAAVTALRANLGEGAGNAASWWPNECPLGKLLPTLSSLSNNPVLHTNTHGHDTRATKKERRERAPTPLAGGDCSGWLAARVNDTSTTANRQFQGIEAELRR